MNFIKVHNHIDEAVLINAEAIQTVYPAHNGDFPTANTVVIFANDGRMPNYITETVNELAALLLPGPMVVKALDPGVPERPAPKRPEPSKPCGVKDGTFRSFLEMITTKSRKRCHKPGCDGCPLQGLETTCVTFTEMTDGDIELLAKAYADFEAEETEKKQEAADA